MLQTTTAMYEKARREDYAIGGFIAYNMEMMQALVRAANRSRSPLLLQSSAQAADYAGFAYLAALARVVAQEAEIPVAHHLDHGYSVDVCKQAVDHGFTSVMFDGSALPFEENVRLTRAVVDYAHDKGAVVEGELGSPENDGFFTDPDQVVEFVDRTGVDSLAVAIGNSHGQMKSGKPPIIDFDLLERIQAVVPQMPLVLHALTTITPATVEAFRRSGGEMKPASVVSEEVFRRAARSKGIAKLNIGASLKIAMVTAIREHCNENPANFDPRKPLALARQRLEDLIVELLNRCGSAGRA